MALGRDPISIEVLVQRQKEEKEAAAKACCFFVFNPSQALPTDEYKQPKFLSKEERAKLAIEKRAQEIREQKGKDEIARAEREQLERQADELRFKNERDVRDPRYGGGPRREYFLRIIVH
jgi:ATP-dependent RNA helicase DDX23/PRP28